MALSRSLSLSFTTILSPTTWTLTLTILILILTLLTTLILHLTRPPALRIPGLKILGRSPGPLNIHLRRSKEYYTTHRSVLLSTSYSRAKVGELPYVHASTHSFVVLPPSLLPFIISLEREQRERGREVLSREAVTAELYLPYLFRKKDKRRREEVVRWADRVRWECFGNDDEGGRSRERLSSVVPVLVMEAQRGLFEFIGSSLSLSPSLSPSSSIDELANLKNANANAGSKEEREDKPAQTQQVNLTPLSRALIRKLYSTTLFGIPTAWNPNTTQTVRVWPLVVDGLREGMKGWMGRVGGKWWMWKCMRWGGDARAYLWVGKWLVRPLVRVRIAQGGGGDGDVSTEGKYDQEMVDGEVGGRNRQDKEERSKDENENGKGKIEHPSQNEASTQHKPNSPSTSTSTSQEQHPININRQDDTTRGRDVLQWLLDMGISSSSTSGRRNAEDTTSLCVDVLFLLIVQEIPPCARLLEVCLRELACRKLCRGELMEEVGRAWKDCGEGMWTMRTLGKLRKVGRFVRECRRVVGGEDFTFHRKVLNPLMLPDGRILPKDTYVAFPTKMMMRDPEFCEGFDGYRFLNQPEQGRGDEEDEEGGRSKPLQEALDNESIGSGNGLAELIVKLVLAMMLREFEFEECSAGGGERDGKDSGKGEEVQVITLRLREK